MDRSGVVKRLEGDGLVAVVRGDSAEQALTLADAVAAGGVAILEITFTVPGAARAIEALAQRPGDLLVGAGSVLDAETARAAILAGARFVVGPSFSEAAARLCNRYQVPYVPGCATVTEMVRAMEAGCEILKLFPGSAFSPDFIRAVRGPLPQVKLMPTGGVDLSNVAAWLQAGAVVVGVGGQITSPAREGDLAGVTERARRFRVAVDGVRS